MRWLLPTLAAASLTACATHSPLPDAVTTLLAEMPEGEAARLQLAGGAIVRAAVPVAPTALPPAVRTAIDAVAPRGETTFVGREWGPRGEGFRIEKIYRDSGDEVRTALIAADGRMLERAHSVPLGEVPQPILAAALAVGPIVSRVEMVSGPVMEEYWRCTVADRIGRSYVVEVGLDGALRSARRRVDAKVDA